LLWNWLLQTGRLSKYQWGWHDPRQAATVAWDRMRHEGELATELLIWHAAQQAIR
jgi:hypothetical protein